uniref:Putative secreted protein n=1 Tax=Anopheles darlingi TaxID=43151 RepID=A0A2M4DNX1_ANODA
MVSVPAMVIAVAVCSSRTATSGTFGAWCHSFRCAIRSRSVIPTSTPCSRMSPSIWTGFGNITGNRRPDRAAVGAP